VKPRSLEHSTDISNEPLSLISNWKGIKFTSRGIQVLKMLKTDSLPQFFVHK